MLLLRDSRIAVCSNNEIRIFNQFNQYKCETLIQRRCDIIYSICELDDDGTIVSCSKDKSIIIGDQIIPKAHFCIICKVICLSGKRIASCSSDRTIKIWNSNPRYNNTPITVLNGHKDEVTSILYIEGRNMLISCSKDNTLRLWNMLRK